MQTHVIIDCGATSAKVAVISNQGSLAKASNTGKVTYYKVAGFNPNHHDWHSFGERLKKLVVENNIQPDHIIFYGTGLTSAQLCSRMIDLLSEVTNLSKSDIRVYSDLMACAHAAYSGKDVIIAIMGTGSNVGYYNGISVSRVTPSLGYLLGDEGSGVDIGKAILKAYHYRQLPRAVEEEIQRLYDLSLEKVLSRIYVKNDLRALASDLAPIAHRFYHLQEVKEIVDGCLQSFITNRVCAEIVAQPLVEEVYIFGSVAVAFANRIEEILKEFCHLKVHVHEGALQLLVEKTNISG